MKRLQISLWIVLGVALFVGVSCSRTPQEEPPSPSAGPSGEDANAASPEQPPTEVETQEQHKNDSDSPTGSFVGQDIDLNSGDLRGVRPVAAGPPQYVISESALSKEVRRLGIPIPAERRWEVIGRSSVGGMHVDYIYGMMFPAIQSLLTRLDEVKATDEERWDVLEALMTSLRTDRPIDAFETPYVLLLEVCDRHGLESPFIPEVTEQFRKERSQRPRP